MELMDVTAMAGNGVMAVVVTYRPDLDLLAQVLDSVCPQVDRVLVFDNASPDPGLRQLLVQPRWPNLEAIYSASNLGVAAAVNRAAAHARGSCRTVEIAFDENGVVGATRVRGIGVGRLLPARARLCHGRRAHPSAPGRRARSSRPVPCR